MIVISNGRANNGPLAITRTFLRDCGWDKVQPKNGSDTKGLKKQYCGTLAIASKKRFYPIHWETSHLLLEPWVKHCERIKGVYRDSVGVCYF